nr:ABC transporter permease [Pseudonocardia acaciae]
MGAALWAEALKLRRSRARWVSVAAILAPTLMAASFVAGATPEGAVGAKLTAMGLTRDVAGYVRAVTEIDAIGGLVVFGFLITWAFGREFSDRTALDLLALPTSRTAVVTAKLIVMTAWMLLLGCLQLAASAGLSALLGLPGWSLDALESPAIVLGFNAVLVGPIALATSVGRGYLAGIATTAFAVVLGVVLAGAGVGGMYPWSVPAIASGMLGPTSVGAGSFGLAAATAAIGVLGTSAWWNRADHH